MKRVLYLRTDLGTRDLTSGGSMTHTLGVLNGLKSRGIYVYCASSAMHNVMRSICGMLFIPLRMPWILSWCGFKINCLISNVVFFLRIMRVYRFISIDCVYQRYSMLNVVGLWIARLKKVLFILEFNGSEVWVDEHWSPRKKLSMRWLIAWCEQKNLAGADYIVVVSCVLRDMLIERGICTQKILINPNGVDIDIFDGQKYKNDRDNMRNYYGITDKYVFGFIGTFSYWHGVELIMDMIPAVIERVPQAHFFLIGTGPLHAACVRRINEMQLQQAITFVGSVPYESCPAYLAVCDAYLCPSQPNQDGTPFFGSPTKLFEYMSMAKPIIASDITQLKEVLDASCAHLVRYNDVEGFISAACALAYADKEQQKNMGVIARNKVLQKYSWQKHVDAIIEFVS